MSLETIKNDIQKRLSIAPPLGYIVELDFGDEGHLFLDGHQPSTQVLDALDQSPDTILALTLEKMQAILDGNLDPSMAVLLGQMKVSGKMGVALKLSGYLEQ